MSIGNFKKFKKICSGAVTGQPVLRGAAVFGIAFQDGLILL